MCSVVSFLTVWTTLTYTYGIYSTHAIYPRRIKKQTRGVIYIRNNSIDWKGCRKNDQNNFIDPVGCKKYDDTSSAWNVIRYLLNPSDCRKFAIVMASPWPRQTESDQYKTTTTTTIIIIAKKQKCIHEQNNPWMQKTWWTNQPPMWLLLSSYRKQRCPFNLRINPKQNAWTCFAISYTEQPKISTIQDSGLSHNGEVWQGAHRDR